MKAVLMNSDGKYTSATTEIVMTKQAYEFLSKETNSPLQKELDLVLPLISTLPVFIRGISRSLHWVELEFHGVINVMKKGTACPDTNLNILQYQKDDFFGMNVLTDMLNNKDFIIAYDKIFQHYNIQGFNDFKLEAKKFQKNINLINNITILDEIQQMLGTDSSVVIFKPQSNGFLNDKGTFTSLSAARFFQSIAVAQTTAKSRQLTDVIFVDVNVDFKKISDSQLHSVTSTGNLGVLIAEKEKEELLKSMNLNNSNEAIINILKEQHPEVYDSIVESLKPKPTTKSRRI